jgi:hypothetical protein
MKKNSINPRIVLFVILGLAVLYFVFFRNASKFGFGTTGDIVVPEGITTVSIPIKDKTGTAVIHNLTVTIQSTSTTVTPPAIVINSLTKGILSYNVGTSQYTTNLQTTSGLIASGQTVVPVTSCITDSMAQKYGSTREELADDVCKSLNLPGRNSTIAADSNGCTGGGLKYTCAVNTVPVKIEEPYTDSSITISYQTYFNAGGTGTFVSYSSGQLDSNNIQVPIPGYLKVTVNTGNKIYYYKTTNVSAAPPGVTYSTTIIATPAASGASPQTITLPSATINVASNAGNIVIGTVTVS